MEATPVVHNAGEYRGFALAQLRILSDYCKRYKLNIASRKVVLNNGVAITCSYCYGKEDVWVTLPPIPSVSTPDNKPNLGVLMLVSLEYLVEVAIDPYYPAGLHDYVTFNTGVYDPGAVGNIIPLQPVVSKGSGFGSFYVRRAHHPLPDPATIPTWLGELNDDGIITEVGGRISDLDNTFVPKQFNQFTKTGMYVVLQKAVRYGWGTDNIAPWASSVMYVLSYADNTSIKIISPAPILAAALFDNNTVIAYVFTSFSTLEFMYIDIHSGVCKWCVKDNQCNAVPVKTSVVFNRDATEAKGLYCPWQDTILQAPALTIFSTSASPPVKSSQRIMTVSFERNLQGEIVATYSLDDYDCNATSSGNEANLQESYSGSFKEIVAIDYDSDNNATYMYREYSWDRSVTLGGYNNDGYCNCTPSGYVSCLESFYGLSGSTECMESRHAVTNVSEKLVFTDGEIIVIEQSRSVDENEYDVTTLEDTREIAQWDGDGNPIYITCAYKLYRSTETLARTTINVDRKNILSFDLRSGKKVLGISTFKIENMITQRIPTDECHQGVYITSYQVSIDDEPTYMCNFDDRVYSYYYGTYKYPLTPISLARSSVIYDYAVGHSVFTSTFIPLNDIIESPPLNDMVYAITESGNVESGWGGAYSGIASAPLFTRLFVEDMVDVYSYTYYGGQGYFLNNHIVDSYADTALVGHPIGDAKSHTLVYAGGVLKDINDRYCKICLLSEETQTINGYYT